MSVEEVCENFKLHLDNILSTDNSVREAAEGFFHELFNQNFLLGFYAMSQYYAELAKSTENHNITLIMQIFLLLKNFFAGHYLDQKLITNQIMETMSQDENEDLKQILSQTKLMVYYGVLQPPPITDIAQKCLSGICYYYHGYSSDIYKLLLDVIVNNSYDFQQKIYVLKAITEIFDDMDKDSNHEYLFPEIQPIFAQLIKIPYIDANYVTEEYQLLLETSLRCITSIVVNSHINHFRIDSTLIIILKVIQRSIEVSCSPNAFNAIISLIFELGSEMYFRTTDNDRANTYDVNMKSSIDESEQDRNNTGKFTDFIRYIFGYAILLLNVGAEPKMQLFKIHAFAPRVPELWPDGTEFTEQEKEAIENNDDFGFPFNPEFVCPSLEKDLIIEVQNMIINRFIEFTNDEYLLEEEISHLYNFRNLWRNSFGSKDLKYPYVVHKSMHVINNAAGLLIPPLLNIIQESFSALETPEVIPDADIGYHIGYAAVELLSRVAYFNIDEAGPALADAISNHVDVGSWQSHLIYCMHLFILVAAKPNRSHPSIADVLNNIRQIASDNLQNIMNFLMMTDCPIIVNSALLILRTFLKQSYLMVVTHEMFNYVIENFMEIALCHFHNQITDSFIAFVNQYFTRFRSNEDGNPIFQYSFAIFEKVRGIIEHPDVPVMTFKNSFSLLSTIIEHVQITDESKTMAKNLTSFAINLLYQIQSSSRDEQTRYIMQDEIGNFIVVIVKKFGGNVQDEVTELAQTILGLFENAEWREMATTVFTQLVIELINFLDIPPDYIFNNFIPNVNEMIESSSPYVVTNAVLLLTVVFSKLPDYKDESVRGILLRITHVLDTNNFTQEFIPNICESLSYIMSAYGKLIVAQRRSREDSARELQTKSIQVGTEEEAANNAQIECELSDETIEILIQIFHRFTSFPFSNGDQQDREISNRMFTAIFNAFRWLIIIISKDNDLFKTYKKFIFEPVKIFVEFRYFNKESIKAFIEMMEASATYTSGSNNIFLNRVAFLTPIIYIASNEAYSEALREQAFSAAKQIVNMHGKPRKKY